MSGKLYAVVIAGWLVLLVGSARGVVIENFDEAGLSTDGFVPFDAADVFKVLAGGGNFRGNAYRNALLVTDTDLNHFSQGQSGRIGADQGGTGYFLTDLTEARDTPIYVGEFWGTVQPVPVVPDSTYRFSFWLTNATTQYSVAEVLPLINGDPLAVSPVSAVGSWSDGLPGHQWQQFAFNWYSGAAVSADLSLWDVQSGADGAQGYGNDFGVDTIELTLVPEPAGLLLAGLGLVGLLACRYRSRVAYR